MNYQLLAVQSYYKVLSVVAPKVAANKAFMLFQKVRIKTTRRREKEFYEKVKEIDIPLKKIDYQVYELGDPHGKPVFLVHGWDSNIGSLSRFAFELAKNQYRVIAINLPAHGKSKQVHTNMYECKDAFLEVINYYHFEEPISIIGHSFGSGVIAYALSEMEVKVKKIVFLTVPNRIENIFLEFQNLIQLGNKSYNLMVEKANKILNEDLSELNIEDKLQKNKFEKALIIHDKFDKVLPFSNAKEIVEVVPNIELKIFEKIGHYRMLWNDEVLLETMNFLKK